MGSCNGKHSLSTAHGCGWRFCRFFFVFAVQVVFSFFQIFVFDLDYYGLRCIVGSGTFGNYLFLGVILIARNGAAVVVFQCFFRNHMDSWIIFGGFSGGKTCHVLLKHFAGHWNWFRKVHTLNIGERLFDPNRTPKITLSIAEPGGCPRQHIIRCEN